MTNQERSTTTTAGAFEMINQEHPITPPPELVEQWYETADNSDEDAIVGIANRSAQWGADQELEACCTWLERNNQWANVDINELRDARRPGPPSLKVQALSELNLTADPDGAELSRTQVELIRRALEALPND